MSGAALQRCRCRFAFPASPWRTLEHKSIVGELINIDTQIGRATDGSECVKQQQQKPLRRRFVDNRHLLSVGV